MTMVLGAALPFKSKKSLGNLSEDPNFTKIVRRASVAPGRVD